jgi:hypothetical protein
VRHDDDHHRGDDRHQDDHKRLICTFCIIILA